MKYAQFYKKHSISLLLQNEEARLKESAAEGVLFFLTLIDENASFVWKCSDSTHHLLYLGT